jgi:hypothetical protein
MLINKVDFPEALFTAHKNGSLVVFAGAGVSMPNPSNFPDFDLLAEQVAEGVLKHEKIGERYEPVDRFLGKLKDQGVQVHEKVRRILSVKTSLPNPLHSYILKLFEVPEKVKLVTTNFDPHFHTAAREVFTQIENLEIYSAPALPQGDSFFGIAYLHGSVSKPADRLVLTDSDFGAAYLTRGWATYFLQQLFEQNLVLFIGYSHNDIVVDYLARGLPPQSKGPGRFALTLQGYEGHWKRLGIMPITYPEGAGTDEHACLAPALRGWVDHIWRGTLEHEEKISEIVQRPVSLDPEKLDYISRVCSDGTLVQFFTRHAVGVDWLQWAENKGILNDLFSDGSLGQVQLQLAAWFARNFVCQHPDSALAVLQRKGGFLNSALWVQIALSFHQLNPLPEVVAKWIPLLISFQPHSGGYELLEYRLSACEFPRDEATVLLLYEHLTKIQVKLQKKILASEEHEDGITIEPVINGSEVYLGQVWQKIFEPNLPNLAEQILLLNTTNFQRAYSLLRSFSKDGGGWDFLSSTRAQIESRAFGGIREGIGLLIDITRDTLIWTIQHRPNRSDVLLESWFASGYRLLKRLAIFGVAESSHWTPEQRLSWLLQHNLIYSYGYKPEVFLLIKKSYDAAAESTRRDILEYVLKGGNTPDDEHRQYEIFNLLYWLKEVSPECPITQKTFDNFAKSHPTFAPREHPNLDWWIGDAGWGKPSNPVNEGEILSATPEQLIQTIESSATDGLFGTEQEAVLNKISRTVASNFEWSMQLALKLKEKQIWEPKLWRAIFSGWKNKEFDDAQWEKLLNILLETPQIIPATTYDGAQLLEKGVKTTTHAIPVAHFPLALEVGRKIWIACTVSDDIRRKENEEDWLLVAINDPAGTLLTFWLQVVSRLKENAGNEWSGLPEQHRQFLESVIDGTSYAAGLGRVLIASQIYFLFTIDQEWAMRNVVPMLKPSNGELRAIQAWHGFLVWGSWTDGMLSELMPCFEEIFPTLHSRFGERQRESFCQFLAGIACYGSIDPVQNGWLQRFLKAVTLEERAMWANSTSWTLSKMKEPLADRAWDRWIGAYWQNRIDGLPMPLDTAEISAMIPWVKAFRLSYSKAIEKIYLSPLPKTEHGFFYHELNKSSLPKSYPEDTAKLILYLLKADFAPIYVFNEVVDIFHQIAPCIEARDALVRICDQLARLGYFGAADLRRSLNGGNQPPEGD